MAFLIDVFKAIVSKSDTWRHLVVHAKDLHAIRYKYLSNEIEKTAGISLAKKKNVQIVSSIIADSILGLLLSIFLLTQNGNVIVAFSSACSFIKETILRSGVSLLVNEPIGLKLNKELGDALGILSWQFIEGWIAITQFITRFFPALITIITYSTPLLGLSFSLSVCCDILVLLWLPFTLLLGIIKTIYANQLSLVATLWRLFRGYKWNSLLNREDSHSYGIEQIIVASILFPISVLLLPTVAIFYFFFGILQLSASLLLLLLQLAMVSLRSFPFYSVFSLLFFPVSVSDSNKVWFCCGSCEDSMDCCSNSKSFHAASSSSSTSDFVHGSTSSSSPSLSHGKRTAESGNSCDKIKCQRWMIKRFRTYELLKPFCDSIINFLNPLFQISVYKGFVSGNWMRLSFHLPYD